MLAVNLKSLLKDSVVYSVGNVAEFVLAFFLLPILTRIFSPKDYGVLETIGTFASIVNLLLLLGLNSAVQRFYYDEENETKRREMISTGFWFELILSIIAVVVFIIFSPYLSKGLFRDDNYQFFIILSLLTIPFGLLNLYMKEILRLKFFPWKYNVLSIIDIIVRFTAIIIFVVFLQKGIAGSFYSVNIAGAIIFVIGYYFVRNNLRFQFSFRVLKKLITYGAPLVAAGLANWVINLSDRFFILKLSTLEDLGIYSLANRISSLMLFAITAFHLAWAPFIFAHYKDISGKQIIKKTLTYVFLVLSFLAVFITTFAKEILSLLAPETYLEATSAVGFLNMGLVFLGISGVIVTGISLANKTKYITLSTCLAALINTVFNILLIPVWGIRGAAFATLLAYISLTIIYYIFGKKFYPIDFEIGKIGKLFFISSIFMIMSSILSHNYFVITIIMKAILFLLFIVSIHISHILSDEERNFLKITSMKFIKQFLRKMT